MPTLVDVDNRPIASPIEAQLRQFPPRLGGTTRPPFQNATNIMVTNPYRRLLQRSFEGHYESKDESERCRTLLEAELH